MNYRLMLKSAVCLAISVVSAGLLSFGWLALVVNTGIVFSPPLRFLSIPVVMGLGFATGMWIGERFLQTRTSRFRQILVWPLIGCSVGAALSSWISMYLRVIVSPLVLIVFGGFIVGTVSVALREWLLLRRVSINRMSKSDRQHVE
jgi:hypothetical protein